MRKFTFEEAEMIADDCFPGAEIIETIEEGKIGRWTCGREVIFSFEGKTYGLFYRYAATESAEGSGTFDGAYGDPEDHFEDIYEVKSVEVVVKKWLPVA